MTNVSEIKAVTSERLNHLAIVGAGVVAYPMVFALILIIWLGGWVATVPVDHHYAVVNQQLSLLGQLALSAMAIWGLVVVALVGVVRNIRASLPGGTSVNLDLSDDADAESGGEKNAK